MPSPPKKNKRGCKLTGGSGLALPLVARHRLGVEVAQQDGAREVDARQVLDAHPGGLLAAHRPLFDPLLQLIVYVQRRPLVLLLPPVPLLRV